MSIRMGISLGSLSVEQLNPRRSRAEKAATARIMKQADIEARQKQQAQQQVNAGRRRSSDMDGFFLAFTEHRGSGIAQNVAQLARVMAGSKDQHVLTTGGDTATDEQKRLAKQLDAQAPLAGGVRPEAQTGTPLTDAQIDRIKDRCDAKAPSEEDEASDDPATGANEVQAHWEKARQQLHQRPALAALQK